MYTTNIQPSKRQLYYLSDSPYDRDIDVSATYIKDSIDYNDHPFTSWVGKSSVEYKQVSDILRAYVQLVIKNYIPEYQPNNYPKEYIERIGAAAGQTSDLSLRCMKLLYYGVKQNRIPTSNILLPKQRANDPNYTVPDEPGFIERMGKFIVDTGGGVFNKIGQLTTNTLDTANAVLDLGKDSAKGLGVLGKYGVPLAVASAAGVIIFFGYNIAKTSDADKVIRVVDKMPNVKGLK